MITEERLLELERMSIKELAEDPSVTIEELEAAFDTKFRLCNFVDVTEDDRIGIDMYLRYWWPTWRNLKGILL